MDTKTLLLKAGFDAKILSGGSTGTYNIDSAIDGMTELQVGSYVFMDVDYRRIGGAGGQTVYADFQPSLTVLTTVVNTTHPDRVTSMREPKPSIRRPPIAPKPGIGRAWSMRKPATSSALTAGSRRQAAELGERLEFIVPHCDPSVNLFDRLYACRGEKVEAIWPVAARREFTRG